MPLTTLNKPRSSVFEKDRRATVLNLDNFLAGKVSGDEFFKENYFTAGMSTLVDRSFRQLGGGNAGSSVFLLSQAMGGGKTHSMVALGLLARDPSLRKRVLSNDPAPTLGKVKVIGFNGRNVEPAFGVWGSLAEQLGRRDHFKNYYQPLSAPGPQAWKELLEGQPAIILLDELPPYMEHARSVQIGNSDLAVVTAAALANLLVAASEMDSVCIVISDLGGANWQAGGDMIQHALSNLKNEARRSAVPITPVNPQGDELYHILRCRLFEKLPGRGDIEKVADAYRNAHAEAVKMGLTTTQSDGLYQQILDSYPFHPAWRDLVGRFKENDGFQQTRGVIRLMQMIISKLWTSGRADALELLHPYDIDLNDVSPITPPRGGVTSRFDHVEARPLPPGGCDQIAA
jgi:predicted AAA+ superfamily ATPase